MTQRFFGLMAMMIFCSVALPVFAGGEGGNSSEKSLTPGVIEIGDGPAKKQDHVVPNTRNLRAESGRAFRAHVEMENLAKHDSLKSLADDFRSIKALGKRFERINDAAKTQKAKTDAQNLRVQLQRYKGQKKNKELKKNATTILDALDSLPDLERLKKAEKKYARAQRTKSAGDDVPVKVDYDDAYRAYAERLNKLPKVLRVQFPKFEANPDFKK